MNLKSLNMLIQGYDFNGNVTEMTYITKMISYPIIVLQLFLSCFVDYAVDDSKSKVYSIMIRELTSKMIFNLMFLESMP